MQNKEFLHYVLDQLSSIDTIQAKRMFGGYGLYKNHIFFALIIENILYFKVDHANRSSYEQYHMQPFRYQRNNKIVELSYWEVPADILDNQTLLTHWVDAAVAAAQRIKKT